MVATADRMLVDHDEHGVVAGDGPDHPGEPAAVEGRAYDVGGARRGAQHDQLRRVADLDHPLAEHPAKVVLRRDLVDGELGQGVGRLAAGQPDLDGAQLLEVARDRGLGGLDALGGRAARPAGPGWSPAWAPAAW